MWQLIERIKTVLQIIVATLAIGGLAIWSKFSVLG
jgi:hypothetical protein